MKPGVEGYCWGLLNKLKQLQKENRIFEDKEAQKSNISYPRLTAIAIAVTTALCEQISFGINLANGNSLKVSQVDEILKTTEEFLSILSKERSHGLKSNDRLLFNRVTVDGKSFLKLSVSRNGRKLVSGDKDHINFHGDRAITDITELLEWLYGFSFDIISTRSDLVEIKVL